MSIAEQSDIHRGAGVGRRTFLGYVVGGTTLVAAAELVLPPPAYAGGIPSVPQVPELYDLEDLQTDAALPTALAITITINEDGTARSRCRGRRSVRDHHLDRDDHRRRARPPAREGARHPRAGPARAALQPADRRVQHHGLDVHPDPVAAAVARNALLDAAAIALGYVVGRLESKDGVISAPDGRSISYAELAPLAASPETKQVEVELRTRDQHTVIGTAPQPDGRPRGRHRAKKFTTDLDVPGALPTMVCRPPTLNGSPRRLRNRAEILAMPGVTHVAPVDDRGRRPRARRSVSASTRSAR